MHGCEEKGVTKMVKNTLRTVLLFILVFAILPTGPSDLFVIPFIIERVGLQGYIILSIVLVMWLYKSVEGKTLKDKIKKVSTELKKGIS
jgi:hypothetical protein